MTTTLTRLRANAGGMKADGSRQGRARNAGFVPHRADNAARARHYGNMDMTAGTPILLWLRYQVGRER